MVSRDRSVAKKEKTIVEGEKKNRTRIKKENREGAREVHETCRKYRYGANAARHPEGCFQCAQLSE